MRVIGARLSLGELRAACLAARASTTFMTIQMFAFLQHDSLLFKQAFIKRKSTGHAGHMPYDLPKLAKDWLHPRKDCKVK